MIPETPNKCLPHTRHRTILHTLPRKQDSLKHQTKKRISTNANVNFKTESGTGNPNKHTKELGAGFSAYYVKIRQLSMT